MGNIEDPNVIPILKEMAGRFPPRIEDRQWIAAALARMGCDVRNNATIVFKGLSSSRSQYIWMAQRLPINLLVDFIERSDTRQNYEAVQALVNVGTSEALEALMTLAKTETDLYRLENLSRAAWKLGDKLQHPDARDYLKRAQVARVVRQWFVIKENVRVQLYLPVNQSDQRFLQLARQFWIMETTRRLDLMLAGMPESLENGISEVPLVAIEPIYTPEVAPVLERIIAESTWTTPFEATSGVVDFYSVRSRAAGILAAKTGREYTFVDVDGRTHPGGWNPDVDP